LSLSCVDKGTAPRLHEDNDEGGVNHGTHHDPDGEHISGYIQTLGRDFR
jgi:hypothetical protein